MAEEIITQLRSQELRAMSLKIKKERIDPKNGDVNSMREREKHLIKSLAKLRSDMQLVKRGSSAAR
jgi:hypothetical protein